MFGFEPPREHGHHVVESIEAMLAGTAKVFIGMGGNFIHAVPDTEIAYRAMRGLELTVGIATKLNRGHLVHGKEALILPVVARSEWIHTRWVSSLSPLRMPCRMSPHPVEYWSLW